MLPLFKSENIEDKYNLIIFDTSWIAHASLLAKAYNWMTFNDCPSGHVYGSMSKIMSIFRVYGNNNLNTTELIFVFDEYPEDTYKIYPEYKGFRQRNFDPVPDIKNLVSLFNCYTARADKTEADHVIASLANKYYRTHNIYVVSADRDILQILDLNNVAIVSRMNDRVDIEYLNSKFGINKPRCLALVKAIFGDPSDNIPKLPGRLSHKIIKKYIGMSDGSPKDFYELIKDKKEVFGEPLYEILISNRKQVEKMYGITKIKFDVDYYLTQNKKNLKDTANLLNFLHKFNINKFDNKIDCLFSKN